MSRPAGRATPLALRGAVDWGALAPLRLRARAVAEGVYAGMHRSVRRGAGVEFGGHREYVPGDDLRWLDRRSLLRHERLMVRQFETETDRALCLLVDASASMGFRGGRAPGAKVAFGAVIAAALARVALGSGDPVSLAFLGGSERAGPVPRGAGGEQNERILAALETVEPGGDARLDEGMLGRSLHALSGASRRGAIVVFVSDLVDLPPGAPERVAALAARGRVLVVVQTLDPDELDLPYEGSVRLRALEGGTVVETDAEEARAPYLASLAALTARWRAAVVERGGRLVSASTADDPIDVVRSVLASVR